MEIGAGRDLAMPLALRAAEVQNVLAVDIEPLARLDLIRYAAGKLLPNQPALGSWKDLERLGIIYRAPYSFGTSDETFDCSCSNEVLEHVPAADLPELLKSLRASTRGITIHSIDYSDHYARSDERLSRLNFLRYSSEQWRWFNSGKQYVNRLRHSDYLRLFCNAGFEILEQSFTLGIPIEGVAPEFEHYDCADLFAIKGRIVAR